MHRAIAAKTGWGKSWYGQQIAAANLSEYPIALVLDYKDEFRGLVKAGLAEWAALGPREAGWSARKWRRVLAKNPKLVVARHRLDTAAWREAVPPVVAAAREVGQEAGGAFIYIEEAHQIAPQQGSAPEPITNLATTGRGEQASSTWATQRPALIDETILAQADERLLGGFSSGRDIEKVESYCDYPVAIHNVTRSAVPDLPDSLAVGGGNPTLRAFEEGGSAAGSEWVFSDDTGTVERRDTREVDSITTHHGPEGRDIHDP